MLQERTSRLICLLLGATTLLSFLCFTRLLGPYVSLNPSSLTIMLSVFTLGLFSGLLSADYLSSRTNYAAATLFLLSLSGYALLMTLLLNDVLLPRFMYTSNSSIGTWIGSFLIIMPATYFLAAANRSLFLSQPASKSASLLLYGCAGLILGAIIAHVLTGLLINIRTVLLVLGCLAILLSSVGFFRIGQHLFMSLFSLLLTLSFALYYTGSKHHLGTLPNVVFLSSTMNGQMMIYDSIYRRSPARIMTHDRDIIDAAHLPDYDPILEQHNYSLLIDSKSTLPEHILVFGLGAGILPNTLADRYQKSNIRVTSSETQQAYTGQHYFKPLKDTVDLVNISPRESLSLNDQMYDVVIMNETISKQASNHMLKTKNFYNKVYERLNIDGWFICPMEGELSNKHKAPLYTQLATLASVFEHVSLFATQSRANTNSQTFIAFASKMPLPLAHLSEHPSFHDLHERTVFIDPFELAQYSSQTDDAYVTF